MSAKERLDKLLFERGLAQSREQARRLIMAGEIKVNSQVADKPGRQVKVDAQIEILQPEKYVSRGGFKLEKALEEFSVDPRGKVCVDIGASTGGFSDCLLQKGASRVYSIDVGHGQIHEYLRANPLCVIIEKCNVRYLEESVIPEKADLGVMDVSFISVRKLLGPLRKILKPGALLIVLVKPQFESERGEAKRGVVRDFSIHRRVIEAVIDSAEELGYGALRLDFSPIQGAKGNIEYLLMLGDGKKVDISIPVQEVITNAEVMFSDGKNQECRHNI